MSDSLTFKEAGSILKHSFRTVSKKVYIWAGLGGILVGACLGGALLMGEATQSDMNGEKVTHSACLVSAMSISQTSNGKMVTNTTYGLKTSCGDFKTNEALYKTMSLYGIYNLTEPEGNWANKPTVVSATLSQK